jgi:mono/diheme cytochrome c family protein
MSFTRLSGRPHPLLKFLLLLVVAGCGRDESKPAASQPAASRPAAGATESAAAFASPAAEAAALDQGPRAAETVVVLAPLAATGQMLFDTKGCAGCHTFGESVTAPDLRGVATRRTAAWLRRQVTEPEWMARHDSLTRAMIRLYDAPMSDLGVSPDEAVALVQFMVREDGGR